MKQQSIRHHKGRNWLFGMMLLWLVLGSWSCLPQTVFLEPSRLALVDAKVEMRSVQFYNDKDIVLRRQATSSEVSQSGGKLILVDGQNVQEVVIKAGTPGVCTGVQNGKFLIRFETGAGKILQFYKNSKGAYQIEADRWVGARGQVKYANLEFFIEAKSNDCLLLFKEKKHIKSTAQMKTLKGLKVPTAGR